MDIGSDGAANSAAVVRSPGLSVVPAIDPQGAVPGGQRDISPEDTPDSAKSSATSTRAADGHVTEGARTVGVVGLAPDPISSAVTSKADALPPAFAATGEAASKIVPDTLGQKSAIAAHGLVPTGSLSPAGRAIVLGSGSDKGVATLATEVEAPPPSALASEGAIAKNPPKSADEGSALSVAHTTVVPPGPALDTDKQAALVSPAEASQTTSGVSGRAAPLSSPNTVDQGSQLAADAAANPRATSAGTSTGAAQAGNDDGTTRPALAPLSPPARPGTVPKVALTEQAPVHPTGSRVAALNEAQTMSAPRVSQSPAALLNAKSQVIADLDSKPEQPRAVASSSTKAPISSEDMSSGGKGDAHRANPGETASLVMAPPPAASDSQATLVTISVNDVSAVSQKTTIVYTITNLAASPVDILFIRCNAVDPRGNIVGSVLDYVVNIPAGQEIKRLVHMPSDFASGHTFSCANDAATH